MKKKLLFLLTALLLSGASAFAQGGTTGPLTWELDNGTLTISGAGPMPNYDYENSLPPWIDYHESITAIVMETGVTSIGDCAFLSCISLTSITIPESITTIGDYAFYNCSSLISITIPNSVTTIGEWAFSQCSSLTSITISNSVTTIGDYAFSQCSSLTSITISNSVTTIGNSAFSGCGSLTSITIPNSVTTIGNYAFSGCGSLTSITIPNSVTTIENHAFSYCTSLTSITIPNSVTTIGDYAFSYCTSLTSINVESENNSYASENGVLFNKNKTTLICCPEGKTGAYVIPNSVTTIGNQAFSYCTSLTSITIPNSVTTIEYSAFFSCTSLTSIAIPNSVTTIGDGAFSDCTSLTSIIIPNSVTSIGEGAFYNCSSLTSVIIPNSVTTIGDGVFSACTSLTSIIIPNSVTSIGNYAFYDCSSLTSVTIPDSVTTIGYSAFFGCESLTLITISNNVTTIEDRTFQYCQSLISITIPNSVTTIGNFAFSHCTNLTSIINLNPVPVDIGFNVFNYMEQSACSLRVPTNAVSAYQNAEVWNEFNIVGIYSVNVSANNDEYGTATGGGYYDENEIATVNATTHADYKFVNWTKNGVEASTDSSYSFTVTENLELVANFEEIETYLITVSVNNEEYGTATGGGYYDENETATVTATAHTGYKFANWTKNGVEVSTENPYSFTVTEDVELVANFINDVGVVETRHALSLQVYPNPTTGQLQIKNYELRDGEIEIYDISGKKQSSHHLITSSPNHHINVSHLPSGIYFLKIAGSVVKFVKE